MKVKPCTPGPKMMKPMDMKDSKNLRPKEPMNMKSGSAKDHKCNTKMC